MRCGTKLHNGKEIPSTARVFKSKSGKDCYVSGIRNDLGQWIASVRYIDDDTMSDVKFDKIEPYLNG